jgi:hypothetical protein
MPEYQYEHLLHLMALSFAVQLAYIALPWFRYGRRILEEYKDLCERIDNHLTMSKDVKVLLNKEIWEKIDPICNSGLGKAKYFGTSTRKGIDMWIVRIFFILTFLELLYISIDYKADLLINTIGLNNAFIFWIFIIISTTGIVVPMFNVFYGNRLIHLHEDNIKSIEKRGEIPSPWDDIHPSATIELIKNTLRKSQDIP